MLPAIRLLATSDESIPEQQLYQALHEPFDLEHELSVRWYVVEQLSGKLVYLVSHHIALDGCGLTVLASELFDILDGKAHCPSQLSEKFSQAHLVEVSSVEHSYDAGKSSPKSSSEHGQARKGTRTPKPHVSTSSWIPFHCNGEKRRSRDLVTFAVSNLG